MSLEIDKSSCGVSVSRFLHTNLFQTSSLLVEFHIGSPSQGLQANPFRSSYCLSRGRGGPEGGEANECGKNDRCMSLSVKIIMA